MSLLRQRRCQERVADNDEYLTRGGIGRDRAQVSEGVADKLATEDAIARIQATGRVAGILAPVEADARHWLERGCRFVAVGADLGLLARQSEALAAKFKAPR